MTDPSPPSPHEESRPEPGDVTRFLRRADAGEVSRSALFELVYDELHAVARRHMFGERPDHSLQATVLVHEAWIRLGGNDAVPWKSRAHFFGAAGEAMRRILVDHARSKGRLKRGGGQRRLPLDGLKLMESEDFDTVLALDDALGRLEAVDARLAQIVRLRFWAGLEEREVADMLDVTPRAVRRDWKLARAWLAREIGAGRS